MMFERLLRQMDPIDLSDNELDQVVSKDADGADVTIAELIDHVAPAILVSFGHHAPIRKHARIKPVRSLDDNEIRDVVTGYLNNIPKNEALAIAGYGSFTPDQLRQEVYQATEVGQRYIESVRQHNAFLEEAIKRGNIQKRASILVKIPGFDF